MGSYVYIMGPMSGRRVQEYSTGVQCIYPGSFVRWKVPEYINGFLCIILGLMSGQKVPEDSNGFLCIYTVPFVRWEGPRI